MKASYPDQRVKTLKLEQGKPASLELQPFEVLVFDMEDGQTLTHGPPASEH